MKFSTVLATLMVASGALAAPKKKPAPSKCLSQSDADSIVADFITILNHYDIPAANATAQDLLAEGYTETSDSILSLEGQPLGTVTFVGKQEYIEGVLGAPGVEDVTTLETLVAGCNKIVWYWNIAGLGTRQYPVKGFNLFTITPDKQIIDVKLEFNSVAWGLDTGYQIIFPSYPAPTTADPAPAAAPAPAEAAPSAAATGE